MNFETNQVLSSCISSLGFDNREKQPRKLMHLHINISYIDFGLAKVLAI